MNRTQTCRPLCCVGSSAIRTSVLFLSVCGMLLFVNSASAVPMVSDANLLSNLLPTPSSTYNAAYSVDNATDGEAGGENKDFVFSNGDGNQRVVVNGFNSGVTTFRLWSSDLRPLQLTLKSSTTDQTSLTSGDYETTLFSGPLTQAQWSNNGGPSATPTYFELPTNAPLGTKSLYLDFGTGNDTSDDAGFARISEIQAFYVAPPVPAPEPSTLALAAFGLMAIRARRKRLG